MAACSINNMLTKRDFWNGSFSPVKDKYYSTANKKACKESPFILPLKGSGHSNLTPCSKKGFYGAFTVSWASYYHSIFIIFFFFFTYNSYLKAGAIVPGDPDVIDILKKVNKFLLLKENQNLNLIRFQTFQLDLKTYYNKVHVKLDLWRDIIYSVTW